MFDIELPIAFLKGRSHPVQRPMDPKILFWPSSTDRLEFGVLRKTDLFLLKGLGDIDKSHC